LIVAAMVRAGISTVVLVLLYFFLPFDRVGEATAALLLVAGLLVVAVLLIWQIRATMRSPHPGVRAVESLGASVPLLLLTFSAAHYLLDLSAPGSYTEELTRLDALYFSVTMFATVGFGDIAALSGPARVLTVFQMLANIVFVAVVARVLFGAALEGRRGR
jgi:hypothetical protein